MKSDLDRLMAARELQAIIVAGGEQENPHRAYLANGIDIHGGLVVKKRGSDPALIVNFMEVENAAKSGLKVYSLYDFGWADLVRQAEGNRSKAEIALWGRVLDALAVPPGKIGIYGVGSLNLYLELVEQVRQAYPAYQFVGEMGMTLFDEAWVTKDAGEIRAIREVAQKTSAVLQATWDFIAAHRAQGDTVVNADGTPLTIGEVKRFVRRALLDLELEDTGMIFAQGRDAGIPHSRGEASMALKTGQAIVFDLFPRQLGGGYFHDTTRTWCIDHAPAEVQAAYDQVTTALQVALDAYAEPGQPMHTIQDAVMDYFEANGHPTPRSQPGTTTGFNHGLGHGIGLNIHERPSINHLSKSDVFEIGNVLTIEPGLYYPDQGFGVRVEDSFVIDETGALVSITDFHRDLVLPLRGA